MFMHRLVVAGVADLDEARVPPGLHAAAAAVGDTRLQLRAILDPGFSYTDSHSFVLAFNNRVIRESS